jgi:hypothetical protein
MEILHRRIGPAELIGIAGAMALMSCLSVPSATAETPRPPANELQARATIEAYVPEELDLSTETAVAERHD